jgi:uncharacterized protein (TIGR02677 family)
MLSLPGDLRIFLVRSIEPLSPAPVPEPGVPVPPASTTPNPAPATVSRGASAASHTSRPDRPLLTPYVTRRVDEFAYATSPNHERYRVITRYFHEQHLRLRDWLTPSEVFGYLQRALPATEYTEELCEHDLESLRAWGNLIAEQDTSKARTLVEFYRPRLVYHISQFSVDLETLLLKHEGKTGTGGSLNASLLDRMWFNLEYLRVNLEQSALPDVLDGDFLAREIEEPWHNVITAFTELRDDATTYHHTLSAMRPNDLAQAEAFLIYKDTLLEHLKGFIAQMQAHAPKIRSLITRWSTGRVGERLLTLLVEHDRMKKVSRLMGDATPLDSLQTRTQFYAPQLRSLADWFAAGGGCEFLTGATSNAILAIVRQNERIATRHMVGVSRRRDLERLARAFAAIDDPDVAHRLAARTLGSAQPRHMRGSTHAAPLMTDRVSVWQQDPQKQPLRRIRRGRVSTASVAGVRANSGKLETMRREEEALLQRERQLWNQLFADPTVSFTALTLSDPSLRARLLDVVARCLADPDGVALASDGRQIRLTTPNGAHAEGELVSTDGTLYLPAFTLELLEDALSVDCEADVQGEAVDDAEAHAPDLDPAVPIPADVPVPA